MMNEEYVHYSRYDYLERQKKIFTRPTSLETKTVRRLEAKYVSRSNICDVCFTAKASLTNECNCQ